MEPDLRTDKPNPYGVTIADSDRVNASLAVRGDALPLINLIMDIVRNNFAVNNLQLIQQMNRLNEKILRLEEQVSHHVIDHHLHALNRHVQGESHPKMEVKPSVLDGTPFSEGENDDAWASQDDKHKDDIKF